MKKNKILIVHITGAVLITLIHYVFHNSYVYSSCAFLENLVNNTYSVILRWIIEIAIYLTIGLFTVFNVGLKKDRFFIIKKIFIFLGSVLILNTIFKIIFFLSWAILIGIFGF